MKHLGDISKINGADIEPVDLITFGSPCQDLSVAGKRAGMKHEANGDGETTRSGLFMEAVRIIKEMREATNGKYPRFALWENVPGAFNSNKGEDFRIVLDELIKIIEPEASMPAVPKTGWPYADSYSGHGWSLAYRTFDAQYWGVPQRRRRIYLVADFGSERAQEILFEREGLRGDFAQGKPPRERTAADAASSAGAADGEREGRSVRCLNPWDTQGIRQYDANGVFPTLAASSRGGQNRSGVVVSAGFKAGQSANAYGIGWEAEQAPTLASENGGNSVPSVCCKTWDARGNGAGEITATITGGHESSISDYTNVVCIQGNVVDHGTAAKGNGSGWTEDVGYTLNTVDRPAVVYGIGNGQSNQSFTPERAGALNCMHDQQAIVFDKEVYNSGIHATGGHYIAEGGPAPTLRGTGHPPGLCEHYIVRRLTPTECARLQGFPDGWGTVYPKTIFTPDEHNFWLGVRKTHAEINGRQARDYTEAQMLAWYNKLHTDSAEYKMWGNGIALPTALYCMQGIAEVQHESRHKRTYAP